MKTISLKVFLWIPLSSAIFNTCQAFTLKSFDASQSVLSSIVHTSQPSAFTFSVSRRSSSSEESSRTSLKAQKQKDEEAVLSDLDARVLQEMLRDSDKLNLQDERSMKDLLERGIKAKERISKDDSQPNEESEFKSEAMSRLGSTKLWKALKRKIQDSVESAKIYVANRIERDAKLIASVGLFAFERAMNDVARALPATSSSRWNPKKQFLLSNVTAAESMTEAQRLRQEMSTPLDEIRNVGRQLKDIFRSVTEAPPPGMNQNAEADPNEIITPRTTFSRNLNSAAASSKYSVNDKTKFEKAYKRKQETTLKRERENVLQSSTRLANEVVDKAYQIRREVQAETNEPGYKTKALRAQTAATSRQLAAGAKRILGGAKSVAVKALEASRKQKEGGAPLLPEGVTGVEVDSFEGYPADVAVPPPVSETQRVAPPTLERLELLDELETEMERVLDLLTLYISSPQETWLNPELLLQKMEVNQEFTAFPDAELESVVVAMVKAQALLQQPMSTEDERAMISTLELVLPTIEEICETSLQGGSSIIADYFLQTLLYGGVENGDTPLMLRLDDCLARLETLEEEQQLSQNIETATAVAEAAAPWYFLDDGEDDVQETKTWYAEDGDDDDRVVEVSSDSKLSFGFRMPWQKQDPKVNFDFSPKSPSVAGESSVVVDDVEILDAIPSTMRGRAEAYIVDNEFTYTQKVMNQKANGDYDISEAAADSLRRVSAEVVSDDDFDVAMGQAKVAKEIGDGEEEEEEEELNAAAMFALRSLDVVLLAGEKTASVLPALMNLGGTVTERVANAKSDGLGSSGWEIIQSAQRGEKKY